MALHENEIHVDEEIVRAALARERPEWAALSIRPAGGGTDNTMYRLGDDLVVRIPRSIDHADALRKEARWLPRFAGRLPVATPLIRHLGQAHPDLPVPWAVLTWLTGHAASTQVVSGWEEAEQARLGRDLAGLVQGVRDTPGPTARQARHRELQWYRAGELATHEDLLSRTVEQARALLPDLDVSRLTELWRIGVNADAPSAAGWLHADLRPANFLVIDRRLSGLIDFGGLSYGRWAAEHAPTWDLPATVRIHYRRRLALDDATWAAARAWAILVALTGIPYYWTSGPGFVHECRARLVAVLEDDEGTSGAHIDKAR